MSATKGSTPGPRAATDRVLPITRALSIVIIPFLLVAFVVLYFWPSADDTARLFAWRITPGFTSMLLAAVYLGGAYFFLRVVVEREWHRIAGGFIAVGCFATLMGVATILHWDKFIHYQCRVLGVGRALFHHTIPGVRGLAGQPAGCRAG